MTWGVGRVGLPTEWIASPPCPAPVDAERCFPPPQDCLGRRELIARALEAGGHGKAHADRPRRTSFSDGRPPPQLV